MDTCQGKHCPLIEKKCIEHRCAFYQHVLGQHPQSGEQFDSWDCAHRWHNVLLLASIKQQSEIGASVQDLRNETSKSTLQGVGQVLRAVAGRQQRKLGDGT